MDGMSGMKNTLPDYDEVKQNVQEWFVDEMNLEDRTVGVYALDKIDEDFVDEIKDDGDMSVIDWSEKHVTFTMGGHEFRIELVTHNQGHPEYVETLWELV